ncbi:unnamed protein product [Brachionus calyciflorus]|uniref:Innexin n=1 Tax=Brachionus calyciflorus TaxID=104777 RepID=A0A813T3C6_9BILA|nr:unnamed protein product [Brachionus calyciflorus]
MDILSVVTRFPILVFGVERHDDDFADRINYKYTVAVLVIFAIIVTNRQFGTKQIHCWIPAYFTRNYEEYINDICWVSNTYYISLDQKLPEAEQIRKSFELKYYQWVPFILLSQAFFFYIPHIAWRALSRRSGIDIRDIVEAASNYKSVDKYENRQKYMTYMLTAVDQYVDDPRRRKETRRTLFIKRILSVICCISGKFLGNYLMVLYLFIKLAFIANCISQLFVLNLLLGHEFHKFGFELLDKIINGKGWDTGSRIFPKISMCDFRIREVGNPKVSHRYTVQCVLPINLFNQQIFTFIWFWYGIVLIVNIYSLCVWTYRFLPSKRLRYITRRIEIMRQALLWKTKNPLNFDQIPDLELHEFEKDLIQHFVHDYLESDGLFILRVLSSNTSDFVCTELIQELWKYYRKQRKFNRSDEDDFNDDDEYYKRGISDYSKPDNNEASSDDQIEMEEMPPNNNYLRTKRNTIANINYKSATVKTRFSKNIGKKQKTQISRTISHDPGSLSNNDSLENDEPDVPQKRIKKKVNEKRKQEVNEQKLEEEEEEENEDKGDEDEYDMDEILEKVENTSAKTSAPKTSNTPCTSSSFRKRFANSATTTTPHPQKNQ